MRAIVKALIPVLFVHMVVHICGILKGHHFCQMVIQPAGDQQMIAGDREFLTKNGHYPLTPLPWPNFIFSTIT